MAFIFNLYELKEGEQIRFTDVNIDILNNTVYTQYLIQRNKKNNLVLKFNKNHHVKCKNKYCCEFTIKEIYSVKNTSKGEVKLPDIIITNEKLQGEYEEGYFFRFERIVDICKELILSE